MGLVATRLVRPLCLDQGTDAMPRDGYQLSLHVSRGAHIACSKDASLSMALQPSVQDSKQKGRGDTGMLSFWGTRSADEAGVRDLYVVARFAHVL
jgi:hypothetical protein